MKLLTKAIIKKLPPLYSQEGKDPKEVPIIVKFFTPDAQMSWYATEFDGKDTFFGWCDLGFGSGCSELGYFSLSELKKVRGNFGLPIERDMYMSKMTLQDVMDNKKY